MYQLVSKKTGKLNIIDSETYESLKDRGELNKFIATPITPAPKVIPEEIIVKKKITKTKDND